MITKFNKFNESKEDQMTVNIMIDTNYGQKGMSSWTIDNKDYLKAIHGSYMGGQLEANINRDDFDVVAKLPGVVDIWEIDWIEPKAQEPKKEEPKKNKPEMVLASVDKDGNIVVDGKIIGTLPPDHPLRGFGDYEIDKSDDEKDSGDEPTREKLIEELCFDVKSKNEFGDAEFDADLVISFWSQDGVMYDDSFPTDLFPEFDDLEIYEFQEGQFEYSGSMSKEKMIKALEKIGFEHCYQDWMDEGNSEGEPEEGMELESITCKSCGGHDCEFMVSGYDWGTVHVDGRRNIVFSYDKKINKFPQLESAIKRTAKKDLSILASCSDCEDEAFVKYKFDNGYTTTDDEEAFKLTYPELFK